MSEQKSYRCAVYTRKSSEEGLEQDFNSLEAQREACEAYVRSQSHEGWKLIPDRFDDGGFSGGNMERPALSKLMSMIRDGKVDVIVIYKIDRLTRSLTDFARLAETFDKHGVSFVSVTQQFNTTTSMGRLMLNVLLSFAQFEREITGERIRDKIAASKKKGMWMGGPIPIGYDVKDRQLVVNKAEAASVQKIFSFYLDEGNVPSLLERLVRERIRTPIRTSAKGRESGGRWFTRGHIYKLLSNPLYVGRIAHKGASHPGRHDALIDTRTWDAVQAKLAANTQGERARRRRASIPAPLLAGLLYSEAGRRMVPAHAMKSGRRYDYYVEQLSASSKLPRKLSAPDNDPVALAFNDRPTGFDGTNKLVALRLPAAEIDAAVVGALQELLSDRIVLLEHLGGISADEIAAALAKATEIAESGVDSSLIGSVVGRVVVGTRRIRLETSGDGLRRALGLGPKPATDQSSRLLKAVEIPLTFRKRGRQLKLVMPQHLHAEARVDHTLATAVARAFEWFERLATAQARSIAELALHDGFDPAYISHILPLAFLAPAKVESILRGQAPVDLTADRLIWHECVPLAWEVPPWHLHLTKQNSGAARRSRAQRTRRVVKGSRSDS